jgi:hypothetical protein
MYSYFSYYLSLDRFLGGLPLYFWILVEGDRWILAIVKKALRVFSSIIDLLMSFGLVNFRDIISFW